MSSRILLVEDNLLTAKGVTYLLEHENYRVAVAHDLATAHSELAEHDFNLILLDVALPDGEGFELAHELGNLAHRPKVIFLTAKDDETDVVHGLNLGDDYVTKPFRNRELLLRIRNALGQRTEHKRQLSYGSVTFDLESNEVAISGNSVDLTAVEVKLLRCLLENAGHIVSRARLLDEIWEASGSAVNDNTLSVYLGRLRQKLGRPDFITTVKNLGYRLEKVTIEAEA